MFIVIAFCLGIFFIYFFTYPYEGVFNRKLKRILHLKEVKLVSRPKKNYKIYSKSIMDKELILEEKIFSSSYVEEKMRVLILKPRILKETPKCLILFHGIRDRAENWINKAKLRENYLSLREKENIGDIVFILPDSGYNAESWYTNFYKDTKHRYEDFFAKELITYLEEEFPNSKKGIAGFSMGGYGAVKIGLKNLELFETIASFSGAISIIRMSFNRRIIKFFKYLYFPKYFFKNTSKRHFLRVFSPWGYRILRNDPYTMMKKMKKCDNRFYFSVGSDDKKPYLMFQQWLDIVGRAKKFNLDFKAVLYKHEKHNWDYVSKDIYNFLKYFMKN